MAQARVNQDERRTEVFLRQSSRSKDAPARAMRVRQPGAMQGPAIPPQAARYIFSAVRRLALQQSLDQAEHVLTRSTLGLTGSDRAYCLFYRNDTGSVWNLHRASQSSEMNQGSSLSAYVGQRSAALCLDRAASHPHYKAAVDDPFGSGQERILMQPVVAMGQVVAVLVLVRNEDKAEYQDLDRALIATLAQESAGVLVHFLTQMLEAQGRAMMQASEKPSLFRQEALSHRDQESALGEVLQLRHPWMSWAYRLLLLASLLAFLLVAVVPVHQYAGGSTLVRMEGTPMRVAYAGTVERSHVVSGDTVTAGQLLVEFTSVEEEAKFAEVDQQYQRQLATLLEEPTDKAARTRLRGIVAQREQALERLERLRLRATKSGIVADLRVQVGQLVSPGQPIVTIVEEDALPTLLAFLPGNFRPQLQTGMPMRFRLSGYARADQEATIEWISREVVGPNEARRHLGPEMADAVAIQGPVVLVRARLNSASFSADGMDYRFHNGMYGSAEIKIGSETILSSLLDRE